jgi:hypothetical protein
VLINNISDLSLQYDEVLALLRVDWTSGADMRTFRHSAEQLLQSMSQLGVRHLLLNMNTFPDISVYDQVWLGTYWMPVLVQSSLERLVLVNHRRRLHNQMAIDALLALARPFIRFDIQYFPQPAAGMHWLSDYSDRLPALLAEWEAVHGPGESPALKVAEAHPRYRPYEPL